MIQNQFDRILRIEERSYPREPRLGNGEVNWLTSLGPAIFVEGLPPSMRLAATMASAVATTPGLRNTNMEPVDFLRIGIEIVDLQEVPANLNLMGMEDRKNYATDWAQSTMHMISVLTAPIARILKIVSSVKNCDLDAKTVHHYFGLVLHVLRFDQSGPEGSKQRFDAIFHIFFRTAPLNISKIGQKKRLQLIEGHPSFHLFAWLKVLLPVLLDPKLSQVQLVLSATAFFLDAGTQRRNEYAPIRIVEKCSLIFKKRPIPLNSHLLTPDEWSGYTLAWEEEAVKIINNLTRLLPLNWMNCFHVRLHTIWMKNRFGVYFNSCWLQDGHVLRDMMQTEKGSKFFCMEFLAPFRKVTTLTKVHLKKSIISGFCQLSCAFWVKHTEKRWASLISTGS